MVISSRSTETSVAPAAGELEETVGRSVSMVNASSAAKGIRRFPLPSMAPDTETDAAPEGISAEMVRAPLQVEPVNCRLSKG